MKVRDKAAAPRFALGVVSALGLGLAGAAIGLVALYVSLPAAAIVYAVAYTILTWVRPDLALMMMFAAAAFPYDVGPGSVKMALAEINLMLAAPVLLIRAILSHQKFSPNPIKWPVLAYFVVCIVSSLHGGLTADGVKSIAQMALYLILAVFVFSSCVNDLRLFYTALYGLLLSAAILGTVGVITRQEYLLGIHKNSIGTSLSYAVIVCSELWFAEAEGRRKRRLALLGYVLIAALVFSLSRGAWVAAAFGLAVVAAMRGEFRLLLRGAVASALIILVCWQLLPKARQDYATDFGAESHNVKTRLISIQYAMHYFETSPVLGAGVGLRKQYDATNVVMSTLAETGVLGLATFMAIFLVLGWSLWSARRQIPARDPAFSLLVIGLALALAQFLHGLLDFYWSRALLVPWASAGMAAWAYSRVEASAAVQRLWMQHRRQPAGTRVSARAPSSADQAKLTSVAR